MTGVPPVTVVCCGLIGTLVTDDGTVERAYSEAIATQGVVTGTADYARCMVGVHRARGQPVIDVLQSVFPGNQARAQAAELAFNHASLAAFERTDLVPVRGAAEALGRLAAAGVRVCVFTGLPRQVLRQVLGTLGWLNNVDLALSPADLPRGCPWPDPVLASMLRLGVGDVREAAVVHCCESGVLSGRRSGAGLVAGALSGPHTADRLRRAGATHILASIAELPGLAAAPAGGLSRPDPERAAPPTAAQRMPQPPAEARQAGSVEG